MTKRRLALLAGAVTGSLLGVGEPAQAETGLMLMPTAFVVATLRLPNLHADCSSAGSSAISRIALFAPVMQSKAQAILSGQVSRLEQITRQQQGLGASAISVAPLATYSVASAPSRLDCQGYVRPLPSLFSITLGTRDVQSSSEDFLGSKRLLVHKTAFDASWKRVRSNTLSSKYAEALLGQQKGAVSFATLATVNAWTNRNIRYVEDQVQYGKADYWADARTTLRRRAGDCEDIAIAKMQLLAALGLNRSDMYLTITRDLVRNADHAVLIVKMDGRNWLLDGSTDAILDASTNYDYRPIMSFSQSNAWIHGYTELAANVQ